MSYLLDTSIAIELRERRVEIARRVAATGRVPAISILTLVELEAGVAGDTQDRARRRVAVDMLVGGLRIMDFDRDVVRTYAEILKMAGFSRRRVIDRLIAATALVHDLTLVTTNGADFRDIPDLRLAVWPVPAQ